MATRAIASASVSFGLVTIPVLVYPAAESRAAIRFHWLHKKCGTRLKQQSVCPKDDDIVPRKEMVKGYEVTKGRYVAFTPEELKALEEKATQTIDVTEFVAAAEIDPLYFDRAYHLGPGKGGQKAFAVFAKALAESERVALGKYAARGKQYLVAIRKFRGGLVMHQLHYADEIRRPVEVSLDGKVRDAEVRLAKQLIDQITAEKFNPEAYEDEVRARVRRQIHRKLKGEELIAPAPESRKGRVVDLMEALKASIASKGAATPKAAAGGERRPARRASRSAARSRRRKRSAA